MELELVFDERMPSNTVQLATSAELVRVLLSSGIDIPTLLALHPQIRAAITQAMQDNAVRADVASVTDSGRRDSNPGLLVPHIPQQSPLPLA